MKLDMQNISIHTGTGYPPPFDAPCLARIRKKLGDAGGLTQFGINLVTLPPGSWSSQRHWHSIEDEFVFVISGVLTLVDNDGEHEMKTGDCATFPAGQENGHHLQNRSDKPATYLEIGTRRPQEDTTTYPDIDMIAPPGRAQYCHRDGTPYSAQSKIKS